MFYYNWHGALFLDKRFAMWTARPAIVTNQAPTYINHPYCTLLQQHPLSNQCQIILNPFNLIKISSFFHTRQKSKWSIVLGCLLLGWQVIVLRLPYCRSDTSLYGSIFSNSKINRKHKIPVMQTNLISGITFILHTKINVAIDLLNKSLLDVSIKYHCRK